jgi:hypothetical protein
MFVKKKLQTVSYEKLVHASENCQVSRGSENLFNWSHDGIVLTSGRNNSIFVGRLFYQSVDLYLVSSSGLGAGQCRLT